MEVSLSQALRQQTSSFLCLESCDNFCSEALKKSYHMIGETLKLLKPIFDYIIDTSLDSDDLLNEAIEQLVLSLNGYESLVQSWTPLASRIRLVLQAERLAIVVHTSVLEILRLLKVSDQCPTAELSSEMLEYCSEQYENIGLEPASNIILEAKNYQPGSQGPERLIEIAGYLGLCSNQEILIEAAALEKLKKNLECAESDFVDVVQLLNLMTYMHDCLFILKQSQSGISIPIPTDYICPLSLAIMRNPVIVSSGISYERSYIQKWIDLGLNVCPKTRQKLRHTCLIPNYTGKTLIANWCNTNTIKLVDPMESINEQVLLHSCSALVVVEQGEEVKRLVKDLTASKSIESLREAIAEAPLLSKQNMDNSTQIASHGGIRSLIDLVQSTDSKVQENAVTTLLYLAINNDNKHAIANADGIEPLICVLETGTPVAQENSAATLFCLSMIQENKLRIGRLGGISPLVKLLDIGTPRGKNNALIALFNLSITNENRGRIVHAGGVKHIVELMMDPVADSVDKAVALLECLSRTNEGRTAISEAGGIPFLVEVVELGSARGKENAASALLQLCVNSIRYSNMALHEGAVPPLAALSLSGTPRAKDKARCLLSHFRGLRHPNAGGGPT